MTTVTTAYVVLWYLAVASNIWEDMPQAGYSFQEGPPIFLAAFLPPAAVAVFVKWRYL